MAGHPDTGAYNVNDALAAIELNVVNRTINRTIMTATEVYNAIVSSEYIALTTAQQEEIWNILHLGEINPFGLEATRFTTIFGGASSTITALAVARKSNVSRAVELGLGFIRPGNVTHARAL